MTEESWVWRELTQHHYGEVTAVTTTVFVQSVSIMKFSWGHTCIRLISDDVDQSLMSRQITQARGSTSSYRNTSKKLHMFEYKNCHINIT